MHHSQLLFDLQKRIWDTVARGYEFIAVALVVITLGGLAWLCFYEWSRSLRFKLRAGRLHSRTW